MKQTTIPMKADARVVIKCSSDLSVEGIEAATMIVIVDESDTLRMKEENGMFRLAADSDCRVLLPQTLTVTIEKVGGDGTIRNLKGRVIIGKIGGDVRLDKIGGASIESVGGDCVIKMAEGAVEISRVGGDLTAEGVAAVLAGNAGGDIRLSNVTGKVDITAGGDATVKSTVSELPEMRIKAGGDAFLFVPTDAKGMLQLHSGDEDIQVHAAGQDATLEQSDTELPLGEGGAVVALTAGGSVSVSDKEGSDWDFEDESEELEDHWQNFGIEIEKRVQESLSRAADEMKRAGEQVGFAGKHVQHKVEQALRHLEERGINPGRPRKVVGFSMEHPSAPAAPVKAGPSDEERMLVLRMLQEKKISVEEAEKLLNALDR